MDGTSNIEIAGALSKNAADSCVGRDVGNSGGGGGGGGGGGKSLKSHEQLAKCAGVNNGLSVQELQKGVLSEGRSLEQAADDEETQPKLGGGAGSAAFNSC